MTTVEVTCSACSAKFELEAGAYKFRKLRNKSGLMFCTRACSAKSIDLFHKKRGPGIGGNKWGVTAKVARTILQRTDNPALQELLAGQSKYQAQRLKDMREAVQR